MPEKEDNDIIEDILKLPKRNLEARIKQLELDIKSRLELNDNVLTNLENNQIRLEDQLWRFRYISPFTDAFLANRDLQSQLQRLNSLKINEQVSCFQDIQELREKLQFAREELETAKKKFKLVSDT